MLALFVIDRFWYVPKVVKFALLNILSIYCRNYRHFVVLSFKGQAKKNIRRLEYNKSSSRN